MTKEMEFADLEHKGGQHTKAELPEVCYECFKEKKLQDHFDLHQSIHGDCSYCLAEEDTRQSSHREMLEKYPALKDYDNHLARTVEDRDA